MWQKLQIPISTFSKRTSHLIISLSIFVHFSVGIQAYKKWVSIHGEEPLLPGVNLTHDQLFFLNYAQIWCGSMRPEDALTKIRSSVHSPGLIRVLGPLSNSQDFARAYDCPLGSPMNPTHKCSVWYIPCKAVETTPFTFFQNYYLCLTQPLLIRENSNQVSLISPVVTADSDPQLVFLD